MMFKQFFRFSSVLFLLVGLFFTGCGKKKDDEKSTSKDTTFLLTATEETAPVIDPGSLELSLTSSLTGPYQYVFDTLRSWNPETDNGKVDMTNIYHVLDVAAQKYENSLNGDLCAAFDAKKTVDSPFVFADFTDTYSCAGNSGAMGEAYPFGVAADEESGDEIVKHLLTGFVWAGTATTGEYNVIQGKYNETTKNLTLRFAQVVNHDQSQFSRRTSIDGNTDEHSFIIRSLYGPLTGEISNYSIVGKGISQGDGKYFLFKVRKSDDSAGDKYICFKASSNADDLKVLQTAKPEGSATVDSNCKEYKTAVDAMTFFKFSDMPHGVSSFTGKDGSSILLDF